MTEIERVATAMRVDLAGRTDGEVERLVDGLLVVLERDRGRWRLAVGREGRLPSMNEVEVMAIAFGVPEGADPLRNRRQRKMPKTGRRAVFQVAELTWREA